MRRGRIDLHIHSTASDGVLTPREIVHRAVVLGLAVIALTDHDTTSGIQEAADAAASTDLTVIPGVEINSEGPWGDLHLLGFYVAPDSPLLTRRLASLQQARLHRAQGMVEKLAGLGMALEWDEVQGLARGQSVGRPHIARALLQRGYVDSVQEAFDRYIGLGGPAYVPRFRLSPLEAIETIHAAGGAAVLAHPAHSSVDEPFIRDLVALGLDGLEVYYPAHSPEEVGFLLALCERYHLLRTGGSDFHGPRSGEGGEMGSVFVPFECVEHLHQAAEAY